MLGPALTQLLTDLAEIPVAERTDAQKAILQELALLAAAFPGPSTGSQADPQVALAAEIRSHIEVAKLDRLSVTRPRKPRPPTGTKTCSLCGQSLP